MRVAAISDTHGRDGWRVPPCDVLVHAGDMTSAGTYRETQRLAEWLTVLMESVQGPEYVILVPGNHDACFEERLTEVRALFGPKVFVLVDEGVTLNGVTFYGSPWTPPFRNWHFMKPEADLGVTYGGIPATLDVLVTHGPPAGVLDPGYQQRHAGSSALWQAVSGRRVQHHVFGHLHGGGGKAKLVREADKLGRVGPTCFYNVAACDDAYRLLRSARVFEVEHAGSGAPPPMRGH